MGGAKTLVRFLAHQEIQQDVTLLTTATYLPLKDHNLFVLILHPILQPVSAQFLWFQISTFDKVSIPTITHFSGN